MRIYSNQCIDFLLCFRGIGMFIEGREGSLQYGIPFFLISYFDFADL